MKKSKFYLLIATVFIFVLVSCGMPANKEDKEIELSEFMKIMDNAIGKNKELKSFAFETEFYDDVDRNSGVVTIKDEKVDNWLIETIYTNKPQDILYLLSIDGVQYDSSNTSIKDGENIWTKREITFDYLERLVRPFISNILSGDLYRIDKITHLADTEETKGTMVLEIVLDQAYTDKIKFEIIHDNQLALTAMEGLNIEDSIVHELANKIDRFVELVSNETIAKVVIDRKGYLIEYVETQKYTNPDGKEEFETRSFKMKEYNLRKIKEFIPKVEDMRIEEIIVD